MTAAIAFVGQVTGIRSSFALERFERAFMNKSFEFESNNVVGKSNWPFATGEQQSAENWMRAFIEVTCVCSRLLLAS